MPDEVLSQANGALHLKSTSSLALCLLVAACGGEPNGFETGCDSQVEFIVSSGVVPEIRWSPACKLGTLTVTTDLDPTPEHGPTNSIMWSIRSEDVLGPDNLLEPSIRYGERPENVRAVGEARPLVTGTTYLVRGGVFTPDGQSTLAGAAIFKP